ncbi:MAG: hypothetical protein V4671_16935 [Armatimonadota bacterium]
MQPAAAFAPHAGGLTRCALARLGTALHPLTLRWPLEHGPVGCGMLHRFEVQASGHGFLKDRPDHQPREQMRGTGPETKHCHFVDVPDLLPDPITVVRAASVLHDLAEPLTPGCLVLAWHTTIPFTPSAGYLCVTS